MSDFIAVQVKPSNAKGFFDVLVRFRDGEKIVEGKTLPHDRMYGFGVQAKDEDDALVLTRSHLLSMVETLNTHLAKIGK